MNRFKLDLMWFSCCVINAFLCGLHIHNQSYGHAVFHFILALFNIAGFLKFK